MSKRYGMLGTALMDMAGKGGQKSMARAAGLSQVKMCRIVTRKCRLSAPDALDIARAFGVDPLQLLWMQAVDDLTAAGWDGRIGATVAESPASGEDGGAMAEGDA